MVSEKRLLDKKLEEAAKLFDQTVRKVQELLEDEDKEEISLNLGESPGWSLRECQTILKADTVKLNWDTSVPKPEIYRYIWHYDNMEEDLHVTDIYDLSVTQSSQVLRKHVAKLNPGKNVSITIRSIDTFKP